MAQGERASGTRRAVVFDMDGVLVESEHLWERMWAAFAAARGKTWTREQTKQVQGMSAPEWSEFLARFSEAQESVAETERLVVDDMIDTGGTITKATKQLLESGAKDVIIAATHGVLSDPATERLSTCGAKEVVLTNTLPIPEEKKFGNLKVLSIAPLLARTIQEVFEDGSVTSLFNGNA